MFNQVVVGVDGRQGGSDAIALATNLLAADGELTLAHIYGCLSSGAGTLEQDYRPRDQIAPLERHTNCLPALRAKLVETLWR